MRESLADRDPDAAVSCIIPVHNGAAFLREALDSVFRQSRPVDEVIVVDDGSTDATAEVVAGYGSPVTYLYQEKAGPAAARNAGVSRASGTWLAFLDADDIWHQDKMARQFARLRARPELECCLTHLCCFWEPSLREEEMRLRREDDPITRAAPGWVFQTLVVSRAAFERVGPLDESMLIGEDTDWMLRAGDLGVERDMLEDVLVFRRLHGNNLSRQAHSARGTEDRLRIVMKSLTRKRGDSLCD